MFVNEICLLTAEVRITSPSEETVRLSQMITDLTQVSFVFHVRSRHACFFQSMCRISVSIRVLDLMKGFDVQIFMCDLRRKAASRLRRESGLLSFFVCLVALVLRSEYVTVQMLRAAQSTTKIHQGHTFGRQGCDTTARKPQIWTVSPPRPAVFDHEVGIDVLEVIDSVGKHGPILTAVCVCSLSNNVDREKGRVQFLHRLLHAERSFIAGRDLAVRNPFDAIEEHITKVYLDSL